MFRSAMVSPKRESRQSTYVHTQQATKERRKEGRKDGRKERTKGTQTARRPRLRSSGSWPPRPERPGSSPGLGPVRAALRYVAPGHVTPSQAMPPHAGSHRAAVPPVRCSVVLSRKVCLSCAPRALRRSCTRLRQCSSYSCDSGPTHPTPDSRLPTKIIPRYVCSIVSAVC